MDYPDWKSKFYTVYGFMKIILPLRRKQLRFILKSLFDNVLVHTCLAELAIVRNRSQNHFFLFSLLTGRERVNTIATHFVNVFMKSFFIGNKEIKLPIIQGGMGVGISLSGLASAVANEGGIGVISCAGLGLLYRQTPGSYFQNCIWGLKEEMRNAREKTKGVVGLNIMVALSNFADMVRTAIAEKADIIFAGAGLPLDLPSYLTPDSKTLLVPIVSSARAAKIICEKWKNNYNYLPDMIVVEGPKAGGHLGFKKEQIDDSNYSLETLIPEVVAVASQYNSDKIIPVIAAGGITTGEDVLRFMELGAAGVQMGSIFVPTYECDAAIEFKQVYINSNQNDMMIIQSPVGMPGRAFDGEFIRSVNEGKETPKGCPFNCIKTCDYSKSPYCIIKALYNAARGNMKKGYAFAGANAYLAQKISSVKEVVANLKEEFAAAKQKMKLNR
jgi:NAD(P)H-dependent flavin oxidoreductase YrpB (nitropropane dioxygenase family)